MVNQIFKAPADEITFRVVVLRINWSLKNLLRLGLEIRKLGHTLRTIACPAAGRHGLLSRKKRAI
jgi:hypothetical protein